MHGTTIAVNTLIQRTGARLGLLVTEGFRDVLELQRLRLPNPFDLDGSRPLPLIPRARVAEVRERLRADGSARHAARRGQRAGRRARLVAQGVEGLVVSLLHAYRNPAHERQARAIAETAAPGLPVSTSADVWPQAREYERTALAVLDAYVQPKVRRYLEGFEQALAARGVPAAPYVTKSNGGIMPVAAARQQTVATLLSGPASGVIGAAYVASQAGLPNVITLDVGGTSADIAVVENGRPRLSTSEHVGGVPVMMPVVGVTAIGAGGGSVAWVDDVGVPKVGPQSTGAHPGPACYGRGGKEATLTDAFLVSGFLDPERFLGGRMPLHRALAEEAIARFADPLGHDAARGGRERGARRRLEHVRGVHQDPLARRGGPARLRARRLRRRRAGGGRAPRPRGRHPDRVRPALAGDALRARRDQRRHRERRGAHGAPARVAANARRRAARFDGLRPARRSTTRSGPSWRTGSRGTAPARGRPPFRPAADMRYVGQSYEIEVPVDPAWLAPGGGPALLAAFHQAHERAFGHADREAPAEIVNLRVQLRAARPRVPLARGPGGAAPPAPRATRRIWLDGRPIEARVFDRAALGRGARLAGPAIVEQPDTTVLVPAGHVGEVDRFGNLILRRED